MHPSRAAEPTRVSACSYEKVPACKGAESQLRAVCANARRPLTDPHAFALLQDMLSLNPAARPSAEQCLQYAYFACEPLPMSRRQFQQETAGFQQSHEFLVKGKHQNNAHKRPRQEMLGSGLLLPLFLVQVVHLQGALGAVSTLVL